jgi:hypothetical protein
MKGREVVKGVGWWMSLSGTFEDELAVGGYFGEFLGRYCLGYVDHFGHFDYFRELGGID